MEEWKSNANQTICAIDEDVSEHPPLVRQKIQVVPWSSQGSFLSHHPLPSMGHQKAGWVMANCEQCGKISPTLNYCAVCEQQVCGNCACDSGARPGMNHEIKDEEVSKGWGGLAPIQVLSTAEAVRKRPTMYFGPVEDIHNKILFEMLCLAREDAQCHDVKVKVTLYAHSRCKVEFSRPLGVEIGRYGKSHAEMVLTVLHACKAEKSAGDKHDFCMAGIACANALCRDLTLIIITDSNERHSQYYSRGAPAGQLEKSSLSPEAPAGTTIFSFQIDFDLFPGLQYSFKEISEWAQDNIDNIDFTLLDSRTGQKYQKKKDKTNEPI